MNKYVELNRVEFLVTKRCNGKCKHCSVPINSNPYEYSYADMEVVKKTIVSIMNKYKINSMMVYGGEPLLYIDKIVDIFDISFRENVQSRDLITSGFISCSATSQYINEVVRKLKKCGVKQILLSVDAFHQEFIPLEMVELFIQSCVNASLLEIILHPAWLIAKNNENEYNKMTIHILNYLSKKYMLKISSGNIIIPSGVNKKYIGYYYNYKKLDISNKCGEIPYTNPLDHVTSIRILPDGSVNICRGITIGNIFENDIMEIINEYNPKTHKITSKILENGIQSLLNEVINLGANIQQSNYYGVCDLCTDCIKYISSKESL